MKIPCLSLFGLLVLGAVSGAPAQTEIPVLAQRVTDYTNTLTFSQWQSIESRLREFEDSTSIQIAILLINSVHGWPIEEYSIRVFEKNKLGQKGKDNGVLVVVARDDRLARLEVGYGLEGVLTDALSSQIIEREMKPKFREGDLYGGLEAGLHAIIGATKGEYTAEPRGEAAPLVGALLVLIALGFYFFIFVPMLAARRRYVLGPGRWVYSSGWGSSSDGGWGRGSGSFGGWSGGGGMAGGGGATGRW